MKALRQALAIGRPRHMGASMSERIRAIGKLGQAIWLDFISRDFLRAGKLRDLINEGVTGVTSNPTIFQKAIATGEDYDAQIRELARTQRDPYAIYEALALRDIAEAADQLRPVYNETHGRDGYVSIEVRPSLAHETQATIEEARRLFAALDRRNVMIKVPATPAGLEAIATLIGEGINVNVTLIFSIAMYERVMEAYLAGLDKLHRDGRSLGQVASVASFFVSRVDTLVDRLISERIAAGQSSLSSLPGQAAVANARIAYDRFARLFESPRFAALRAHGARVQRPLWASTGVKNPAYSSTKYVDGLIGPHTVNTVPPATLDAIRAHATPARTIDQDIEDAYGVIRRLGEGGIDMEQVTSQLLDEGVQLFAGSFDQLLADVTAKCAALRGKA